MELVIEFLQHKLKAAESAVEGLNTELVAADGEQAERLREREKWKQLARELEAAISILSDS